MPKSEKLMVLAVDALAFPCLEAMPFLRHLAAGGKACSVRPAPGFRGIEPLLEGRWDPPQSRPFPVKRSSKPGYFPPLLEIRGEFPKSRFNRLIRSRLPTTGGFGDSRVIRLNLPGPDFSAGGSLRAPPLIAMWERRGLGVWWAPRDSLFEEQKGFLKQFLLALRGLSQLSEILQAFENGTDIAYLEFSGQLDPVGRRHGPFSYKTRREASRLDHELAEWMGRIWKRHPATQVALLSGQGMSPVDNAFDIEALLRSRGLRNGTNYLGVWDIQYGQVWAAPEILARITDALWENREAKVVDPEERRTWFGEDTAYGDLLVACREGTMLLPNHFEGKRHLRGAHGYLGAITPSSRSLCLFSGGGFHHLPQAEVELPDLFPVLAQWGA
jgi:hypothetical protein